jgi:hypothetical protein
VKLELEEVRKKLEKALKARNKEKVVKSFVKWLLSNVITSENIVEAIQNNRDLAELLRENCYLENDVIKPLAKMLMRVYWPEIEDVICNVQKIYELLLKIAPQHSNIISSEKGINYLNEQCAKLYDYLYSYTWSEASSEGE